MKERIKDMKALDGLPCILAYEELDDRHILMAKIMHTNKFAVVGRILKNAESIPNIERSIDSIDYSTRESKP